MAIAEFLLHVATKAELGVMYRQLVLGFSWKLTDVYGKLAHADEKENKHSLERWVWQNSKGEGSSEKLHCQPAPLLHAPP